MFEIRYIFGGKVFPERLYSQKSIFKRLYSQKNGFSMFLCLHWLLVNNSRNRKRVCVMFNWFCND